MASGKSYLSRQIIENLNTITYSEKTIKQTHLLLISKSSVSATEMSNICKKKIN